MTKANASLVNLVSKVPLNKEKRKAEGQTRGEHSVSGWGITVLTGEDPEPEGMNGETVHFPGYETPSNPPPQPISP